MKHRKAKKHSHNNTLLHKLADASGKSENGIKALAVQLSTSLCGCWVLPTKQHAKEWIKHAPQN
jgi:hypothetical protein